MSGLIYVVIIALWAVVLSILIRRHDEASEARSIDRFSTAMRLLSRRSTPTSDPTYAVTPRRAVGHAEPAPSAERTFVKGAPRRAEPSPPLPSTPPLPSGPEHEERATRPRRVARRRRALAVLAGMLLLAGVLSLVGIVPAGVSAATAALLVGYLVHLRLQVRHAARLVHRREAAARSAAARRRRAERAARVDSARAAGSGGSGASDQSGPAGPVGPAGPESAVGAVDDGWEPRPWPLPTYVTAPVAPRPAVPAATVDTPEPEVAERSYREVEPDAADEDFEEIIERRRAVGD